MKAKKRTTSQKPNSFSGKKTTTKHSVHRRSTFLRSKRSSKKPQQPGRVHALRLHEMSVIGFTIIELLVVISITSLLASITLVSLNENRAKARDASKVLNLKTIQNAVQLFVEKNNGVPPLVDPVTYPSLTTNDISPDISVLPNMNDLGDAVGISTMPHGLSYPMNFSIVDYYGYVASYDRSFFINLPGFCMRFRPYSYALFVTLQTQVGKAGGLAPGTGYYVLGGGPMEVRVGVVCTS